jgi:hypothetical protein
LDITGHSNWFSAIELGPGGNMEEEWNKYIGNFKSNLIVRAVKFPTYAWVKDSFNLFS